MLMHDEPSGPAQLSSRRVWRDRIALSALAVAGFAISLTVNAHERLHAWAELHPRYDPFRLLPVVAGGAVLTLVYLIVTRRRLREEVAVRQDRERALTRALHKIEVLSGLLSMCASCKSVRDDDDQWEPVEAYLQRHGEIAVSHDICQECARQLYPGYVDA